MIPTLHLYLTVVPKPYTIFVKEPPFKSALICTFDSCDFGNLRFRMSRAGRLSKSIDKTVDKENMERSYWLKRVVANWWLVVGTEDGNVERLSWIAVSQSVTYFLCRLQPTASTNKIAPFTSLVFFLLLSLSVSMIIPLCA